MQDSSFLMQNSSFLMQDSSFLMQNSSRLIRILNLVDSVAEFNAVFRLFLKELAAIEDMVTVSLAAKTSKPTKKKKKRKGVIFIDLYWFVLIFNWLSIDFILKKKRKAGGGKKTETEAVTMKIR